MSSRLNRALVRMILLAALPLAACSRAVPQTSQPLVTDIAHTEVKRQSIGNCWIYAHATWLESLLLTETGTEMNVSESYWTWWHWYEQIVGRSAQSVQTGGHWQTSAAIIVNHGFVLEGEFLPDEAQAEMSLHQALALANINAALKEGGSLAAVADRTPENVRKALDLAFGSNMQAAESLARKAAETVVARKTDGTPVSLAQALFGDQTTAWTYVSFPRLYGQVAVASAWQVTARKTLFARVFRALNDKKPVVMSLMIDFNAVDTESEDAIFRASTQIANGVGVQGGHMVVLEDYAVNNAPNIGHIGYGDASDEVKAAAALGDLEMLKAKNSWGKDRNDRPWLHTGYTSFDVDYLTSALAWKNSEEGDASDVSYYTTLSAFILPPGY